jgi:4-amino-4-deoxy-L-arabinose transferase-like glycosyltransferase
MRRRFPWLHLGGVLAAAALARAALLWSGAVSFHADEAVVALMARHILQGERPTFFYGQAYMGSLDAWLIAFGFRLFGQSVLAVRLVESALYLLVVAVGFLVAWRLSRRAALATVAGLALAVPTVNVALYTTATLGGYNEVLLLGGLTLLLGYDVSHDHPHSVWRWLALGLCVGVGWWTHGLIVIFALPVAVMVLYRLFRPVGDALPYAHNPHPPASSLRSGEGESESPSLRSGEGLGWGEGSTRRASPLQILLYIGLGLLGFLIGSAPWWVFDFTHNHAALSTYLTNRQTGEFAGIGIAYVPPGQRAIGLALIGLPALVGMRFPWASSYFLLPLGVVVLVVYIVAVYRLLRVANPLLPDGRALVLGMIGLFGVVFVASTFGADPTGRYFLPLALPLGILLGTLVVPKDSPPDEPDTVRARAALPRWLPVALVVLVIGYQAAGQVAAASTPPGFTTQFDLVSHLPNDHDADLLRFLDEHGLYNGYTNYWVAFRLAFLSGEQMRYSAALPYKNDLSYNAADNRYRPYVDATAAAARVAYITTNLPELDAQLEARFRAEGVAYQQERIGPFHIYYDFVPHNPSPPAR